MIWIELPFLLFVSAAISGAETSLFSLSRATLLECERAGSVFRRRVHRVMQNPRGVLMTVLMTNTAVNTAIYATSYVALEQWRGASPGTAAAGGVVVLIMVILLGEMVPKAVALANAERWAPAAAAMIAVLEVVLAPVQWLLGGLIFDPVTRLLAPTRTTTETVTTEELYQLVEHSAREGHLHPTESEMLQGIVGLSEASVRDVMTPRVDIEFVRIDDEPSEIRAVLKGSTARTLPVCGRDLDDIRGMIHARDGLLFRSMPIQSLIRPARFVPEQINLAQLMRHFREDRIHVAIVVDEYGGTAGLVTNEDAVEWIVGDLPDAETPPEAPATERIDEDTYRVAGDLSVRLWAEHFNVREVDRHVNTVGGLILSKLGRLPRVGDSVQIRNLALTVDAMRQRRIESVLLRRAKDAESTAGDSR